MRIQFASDLHMETWSKSTFEETLEPVAPILALCGDIAPLDHPNLPAFLEWCSERWETVLWIPGVAEEHPNGMRTVAAPYQNIIIADHEIFRSEDGFLVVSLMFGMYPLDGMLLWDDGAKRRVEATPSPIPPADMAAHWRAELAWLRGVLETTADPVIVLSHYPPAPWLWEETFVGKPEHFIRSSEEERVLEEGVVAWVCGHTHKTVEFTKQWIATDGTEKTLLLVSNPRGRPLENMDYRRDAVLRLTPPESSRRRPQTTESIVRNSRPGGKPVAASNEYTQWPHLSSFSS